MSARGFYVYGYSYSGRDWDPFKHGVYASRVRQYGLKNLRLLDGPNTKALAYRKPTYEPVLEVPLAKGCQMGTFCKQSHFVSADLAKAYCLNVLQMAEPGQPVIVEKVVERIVERIVEVEKIVIETVLIPFEFGFAEREVMATALIREQHVTNEYLRRALLANDKDQAATLSERLGAIRSVMETYGIEPDDWRNGPMWLIEVGLDGGEEPEQPTLFTA